MPRSADSQPELALQGSLFGEPEPAPAGRPTADEPIAANADLSDADLGADAMARPRKRQAAHDSAANDATASETDNTQDNTGDDQPAWAHHTR